MKTYLVKFYKHEQRPSGKKETYLGQIVINNVLPIDGTSLTAKAFRYAHPSLQVATGVVIEEIYE